MSINFDNKIKPLEKKQEIKHPELLESLKAAVAKDLDLLTEGHWEITEDENDPNIIRFNAELDYESQSNLVFEKLDPILKKLGYKGAYFDAEDSGRWLAHLPEQKKQSGPLGYEQARKLIKEKFGGDLDEKRYKELLSWVGK